MQAKEIEENATLMSVLINAGAVIYTNTYFDINTEEQEKFVLSINDMRTRSIIIKRLDFTSEYEQTKFTKELVCRLSNQNRSIQKVR